MTSHETGLTKPRGGCYRCGGPVRTYKRHGYGWTCAKCVREEQREERNR